MNYGGDAADQVIRYSLEGIDYSLRLSGTLAKNLAVFFAAVLKDQKKTYGKTRMVRMLKENRPLKFFTVPSDRLREFAREGKKRGLLFTIIRDRKNPEQCEVMVFADDAAKVNRVLDKMSLDFLKSESGEAVQEVLETEQAQEAPKAREETVEMPEGEIPFELGDLDQDFGFEEPKPEAENFMEAQEERNLSEPSLRSKDTFTGQESSERKEQREVREIPDRQEKPSVRAELEQIKQEKKEAADRKEPVKRQDRNRSANRKKKKRAKGR